MKSVWTMPKMHIQQFEANESIAACYDVQCTLYERKDNIKGGIYQGKDLDYDTWRESEAAGIWHSSDACGIAGNQVWKEDGGLYENSKNYGWLPCYDVEKDPDDETITWKTSTNDGKKVWHHKGRIIPNDGTRPNHS